MSAEAEFLAAYAESVTGRERTRAESATTRADAAERALAFERAGVPDNPMGRLFERSYTGPVDESEVRLAWAFLREDDSDLDDTEKFVYQARLAGRTTTKRSTR